MVVPIAALLAGIASCAPCHDAVLESYRQTAHFRTSSRASSDTIRGSFARGENLLRTQAPDVYFQMERRADGFYQEAYDRGKTRRERLRGLKAPVRDDEPLDLRALRDEGGDDGADRAGPEDDDLDGVKTPRTRGDCANT